ncbi:MAG TPA: hypothetical protein VIY73_00480 [Polyangiaceae bacterium]
MDGFPWQREERQRVGVAALTANILCGRHNTVLSPIDNQGARLFRTVRRIEESLQGGDGAQGVYLFPGVDIERWMLKALMGLCSAGAARTPDGIPLPWVPPERWLRILYGESSFPYTWGLYVEGRVGAAQMFSPGHVRISPLTTDGEIGGTVVEFVGVRFILVMRDARRKGGAIDDHAIYHPGELLFVDESTGTRHSLCFAWPSRHDATQVLLNWNRP